MEYRACISEENALAHYGVMGMKWGVRRYQPYGHGGYDPEHAGRNTGDAAKLMRAMSKRDSLANKKTALENKQISTSIKQKQAQAKALKERSKQQKYEVKANKALTDNGYFKYSDKADAANIKAMKYEARANAKSSKQLSNEAKIEKTAQQLKKADYKVNKMQYEQTGNKEAGQKAADYEMEKVGIKSAQRETANKVVSTAAGIAAGGAAGTAVTLATAAGGFIIPHATVGSAIIAGLGTGSIIRNAMDSVNYKMSLKEAQKITEKYKTGSTTVLKTGSLTAEQREKIRNSVSKKTTSSGIAERGPAFGQNSKVAKREAIKQQQNDWWKNGYSKEVQASKMSTAKQKGSYDISFLEFIQNKDLTKAQTNKAYAEYLKSPEKFVKDYVKKLPEL